MSFGAGPTPTPTHACASIRLDRGASRTAVAGCGGDDVLGPVRGGAEVPLAETHSVHSGGGLNILRRRWDPGGRPLCGSGPA